MPRIDENDPTPKPSIDLEPLQSGRWANGNRPLLFLLLSMLAAILILAVVTVVVVVRATRPEGPPPLLAELPQPVNGPNSDPNATEDVLHQGDSLIVTSTKCNQSKSDLVTLRVPELIQQDGDKRVSLALAINVRRPGCTTFALPSTIPSDLTPGLYRIEGDDIVISGTASLKTLKFYSETFRVEPKGQ